MKVTLSQSGGWTAGLPQQAKTIDTSALAPDEVTELERLTAAAKSAANVSAAGAGQARDAVTYKIAIAEDGETAILRANDANLSPALANLINWIKQYQS